MKRLAAVAVLLAGCNTPKAGGPQAVGPLPPPGPGDEINAPLKQAVEGEIASLVELYKWFHQNAELSLKEEKTSARFAEEVRKAGWAVTERVGGFGVVGVLKSGEGPTVLARIDMDGLPVKEETGLPYASTTGVMHACGHDSHLAAGVGLARVMPRFRDKWAGTVVLVGQPAEELGRGAKAMLDDPKFHAAFAGKPVACLSVHDFPNPAGTLGICPGYSSANVDSIDITVFGRGGHGAWPHQTVDPIVIAAEVVLSLQTIVSRKLAPGVRAVVTVGSIHGGTKHNIIPDDVKLQLTVRSYEDATRETLLSEIRQIAQKVAEAHRVPQAPEVKFSDHTPAVFHDPGLSDRMRSVFERLVGKDRVFAADPVMGGEDFGYFPRHYAVAGLQFRIGGAGAAMVASGNVPGLHSSKWAVDPEPTLRAGVAAFARGVINLLGKR